ncbi:hypothetical protein HYX10_02575 [Candidatus Woesearchaeota archaeon]|nr:hypothetical protein [Candidatus Woesearchaeota archaeon]
MSRITPLTQKEAKMLAIGLVFALVISMLKFAGPGLTGYAVYEQQEHAWSFDYENDYAYNSDSVEVADGEARLKLQKTTTAWTDSAALTLGRTGLDSLPIAGIAPADYEKAMLQEGDKYYIAGNEKIEEIPPALKGLAWIKTENSDRNKDINVSFEPDRSVTVFAGHDNRDTAPSWLSQWTYWGAGIITSAKGTPFNIYYKDFDGQVLLEASNKSKAMYVVLVNATVYESSTAYASEPHNFSGKMKSIDWDADTPGGTSVKIRIRESAAPEGLGNAEWSSQYTEPGSFEGQISDGTAQYEALLETADNRITPTLTSVTLTFENEEYPGSAEIETDDLTVSKTAEWGSITASEILNGQNISYYYSTDSGATWQGIGNLAGSSQKIRAKAAMSSNKTHTPALQEIRINYTYASCTEDWAPEYTECEANGTKTKYYADANSCGTNDGLPADNGTTETCSYEQPLAVNYAFAEPNAVNPGEEIKITANISRDSSITATAAFRNEKGTAATISLKENSGLFSAAVNTSAIEKGIYAIDISAEDAGGNAAIRKGAALAAIITKEALVESIILSENSPYSINTADSANKTTVLLNILGKQAEGQISVASYTDDFRNTTKTAREIGRYVDIVADEGLSRNITNTTLRIYYSNEELSKANIAEESIKIHYYNETSKAWTELETSVNAEENYAEAAIEHYSTYGIFGQEKTAQPAPAHTTGGSGGYGGSQKSYTRIIAEELKTEAQEAKKEVQEGITEERTQPEKQEEACVYDIEITLPKTTLKGADTVPAEVKNTGNCTIDALEIAAAGDAGRYVQVKPTRIEMLEAAKTSNFTIAKTRETDAAVQGLLIAGEQPRTYDGWLNIQGAGGNIELSESIAISVEFGKQESNMAKISWLAALAILTAAIIIHRKRNGHAKKKLKLRSNDAVK